MAYTLRLASLPVYGGYSARTGERSIVDVNSIVATVGRTPGMAELRDGYIPPLNNKTLFRRDANLCLYCGERFMSRDLTRDHVTPLSKGGTDFVDQRRYGLPALQQPQGRAPTRAAPACS